MIVGKGGRGEIRLPKITGRENRGCQFVAPENLEGSSHPGEKPETERRYPERTKTRGGSSKGDRGGRVVVSIHHWSVPYGQTRQRFT